MSGTAVIQLTRESSLSDCLSKYRILIDQVDRGTIRNGRIVQMVVEPGRHLIELRPAEEGMLNRGMRSRPLAINCSAGETRQIVCKVGHPIRVWALDSSASEPTGPSAVSPAGVPNGTTLMGLEVSIDETDRTSRSLGHDVRLIDNRAGVAEVERQILVSREWSRQVDIEWGSEQAKSGSMQAGPRWISFRGAIESRLHDRYLLKNTNREMHQESVLIRVPAGILLVLELYWKALIQNGIIHVKSGDVTFSLAFSAVVGVTFDQVQRKG